jgi:hypothetical protein
MSDRFKFRIYSFLEKSFYHFSIGDSEDGYPQGLAGGVSEIQQYTGLNDKNNNLIFEGDIVKTIYINDSYCNLGVVIYHNETGTYRIKTSKQLLPIVTYRFVEDKPQGLLQVAEEIIGNIFNPPCNFDANNECLICDDIINNCQFKSK